MTRPRARAGADDLLLREIDWFPLPMTWGPSALAESKRTERFWPLVVTYIAAPEGGEQPSPTASERGSGRDEETACFDQFLQTTRFDTNKPNLERLELKIIPTTSSLTFVPDMFKFWDLKTFLITLSQ